MAIFNKNAAKILHHGYRRFSTKIDHKPSYFHYIGKEPLVYRNIGQQLTITAEKYSDREALVSCHEQRRLTFAQVKDQADKLAAGFHKIGLQKGDRIGLWAPNNASWYITMMAAARAGFILVGLNPAYQVPEMEYCLKKVGVKAIVAPEGFKTQNYYEMLAEIVPELKTSQPGEIKSEKMPSLTTVIIDSEKDFDGAFKLDEISKFPTITDIQAIEANQSQIPPASGCNIQFTSGTTGHPKAALLSHFGFINNGIHIGNRNELSKKHQKICLQVPFFHVYGVVIGIMAALTHGATIVLPAASFKSDESLKAIRNEQCTVIYGTPTMYVDLVQRQREQKVPLTSAEIAVTGGATCTPKLFKDIKNELGLKKVKIRNQLLSVVVEPFHYFVRHQVPADVQIFRHCGSRVDNFVQSQYHTHGEQKPKFSTVFGLTESTAVSFQSLEEEAEHKVLETVGHVQDHVEAKVVNEEGHVVPFGTRGELCIRSYSNMLCYWEDDQKTNEMICKAKWLRTGDQFELYEDGYGKIVGRLKEMIIRGGENIFPKEIEDFLSTHPAILETHVIGVPDERLGEESCAYVKLRENYKDLTREDIKQFCKGKLAHFKIPRYVEVLTGDWPKTQSGKIQKFILRELFDKKYKNSMSNNKFQ